MRILMAFLMAGLALPAAAQTPAAPASGEGDKVAGLEIARTWCANCHVVEEHPAKATASSVPTFAAIADRPGITADGLRAILAVPHGNMPSLSLTRNEVDNVIAYLLSQKDK